MARQGSQGDLPRQSDGVWCTPNASDGGVQRQSESGPPPMARTISLPLPTCLRCGGEGGKEGVSDPHCVNCVEWLRRCKECNSGTCHVCTSAVEDGVRTRGGFITRTLSIPNIPCFRCGGSNPGASRFCGECMEMPPPMCTEECCQNEAGSGGLCPFHSEDF